MVFYSLTFASCVFLLLKLSIAQLPPNAIVKTPASRAASVAKAAQAAAGKSTTAASCVERVTTFSVIDPLSWPLHNNTPYIGLGADQLATGAESASGSANPVGDYILRKHNCLRTKPAATDMLQMVWNSEAAQQAQEWADNCVYAHNTAENRTTSQFSFGQNIASAWPAALPWNDILNMWHNEVNNYVFGAANTAFTVGHYTQMVWAKSFQLGCAYQYCSAPVGRKPFHFYVCHYGPGGNVQIRGNPLPENPYTPGTPCASCQSDCVDGLCGQGSACKYTDKIGNCAQFIKMTSMKVCSPGNAMGKSCMATCNCPPKVK